MESEISNKITFLPHIHFFRGFAILLIVGVHSLISLPWNQNEISKLVFYSITNNGTILFVFIAGYLFYYLNSTQFSFRRYFKKKVLYVLSPYVFCSIPAIVEKLYFDSGTQWYMNEKFELMPNFIKVLYFLITGRHFGPFWFIPMIFIFYLISPALIKFSKWKYFNYAVLMILLAGFFTVQFGFYSSVPLSFIHFLPVYLMGMLISRFDIVFLSNKFIKFIPIAVFLFISTLELLGYISIQNVIDLRDQNYLTLAFNPSMVKSVFLCLLMLQVFHYFSNKRNRLWKILGDYSFGIFFIHLYIIIIFQKLVMMKLITFTHFNALTYVIYIMVLLTINLLLVYLFKKIFKKSSRILIGS
ncbi:MAG: acyltransferase [Cyclobacteriaceae bacterium]|nr:acyltransferase [Cyclobacteriaceae bacterium]